MHHQFIKNFGGEDSPQNTEGAILAPSSDDSLRLLPSANCDTSSTQMSRNDEDTMANPYANVPVDAEPEGEGLPLPADWFRKDKSALVQELGQLSQGQLLGVLVSLLAQETLPRKSLKPCQRVILPTHDASGREIDYSVEDLARICQISRQAVVQGVRRLVENKRLEERCFKPWIFDAKDGQKIIDSRRRKPPGK